MSQPTASSRLLTCQRKLQSMQEDHWEFCLLSYRLNHMQLDCIYTWRRGVALRPQSVSNLALVKSRAKHNVPRISMFEGHAPQ